MNQSDTQTNVPNIEHYNNLFKAIVTKLVQARSDSHSTQDDVANMLGVTRKRIVYLENFKSLDFELLLIYADKFSISVRYVVNEY